VTFLNESPAFGLFSCSDNLGSFTSNGQQCPNNNQHKT
jgi:hypothetical protein